MLSLYAAEHRRCPICWEDVDFEQIISVTSCSHYFHWVCNKQYEKKREHGVEGCDKMSDLSPLLSIWVHNWVCFHDASGTTPEVPHSSALQPGAGAGATEKARGSNHSRPLEHVTIGPPFSKISVATKMGNLFIVLEWQVQCSERDEGKRICNLLEESVIFWKNRNPRKWLNMFHFFR